MRQNLLCELPDCATCPARDHSVFAELQPLQVDTLTTTKGCRTYSKGEIIFYSDTTPSGLFCVHHGTVKIYKVGRDGKEQTIRLAGQGDIIGYRSLISGEKYMAFASPLEEAQLCHIPKDIFFGLAEKSAGLSTRVMKLLADELRTAEQKLMEMAQKPLRERLAETLLILKKTHGVQRDDVTLNITITRTELANIVGTATESVSRALSKMKEEGIIDVPGRKIMILNHRALVEAANLDD